MLHSFKKKVAKVTAPTRGINPGGEFLDYRNRLATLKKSLQYIDSKMDEALKAWAVQMIEQRSFSERFSQSYPISGDDTDMIAKEFSSGSQAVYDYFVRNTAPENAGYHKMHGQVKAYIKEIAEVEAMYGELFQAKSEAERYQSKIDSLERSRKPDEMKKTRNLQKMDGEKQKLAQITEEVLNAQRATYRKAPTVYKAALCAYWSAHEKHTQVLMNSMERTSVFTREAELQLQDLDISQLSLADGYETTSHALTENSLTKIEAPSDAPPVGSNIAAEKSVNEIEAMHSSIKTEKTMSHVASEQAPVDTRASMVSVPTRHSLTDSEDFADARPMYPNNTTGDGLSGINSQTEDQGLTTGVAMERSLNGMSNSGRSLPVDSNQPTNENWSHIETLAQQNESSTETQTLSEARESIHASSEELESHTPKIRRALVAA